MDDQDLLQRIQALVKEEHDLRDGSQSTGTGADPDEVRARLRKVEESLDQCWDLLRQRRAKMDSGEDPDEATPRPVKQVESYPQ